MALRVLLVVTLLMFCLVQAFTIEAEVDGRTEQGVVSGGNQRLTQDIDCAGLCAVRCSLSSRPNLCKRACGTCCARCKCVPPGTAGNREVCGPCYTNMKTHGNKNKCP